MADTPEVQAKNRIKRELDKVLKERQLPARLHWNAGESFGTYRIDFDGVIAGHPFYIEVKRFDGKGKLNARQKLSVREYKEAGAFSMVIDSEASLAFFIEWVQQLTPRYVQLPTSPVLQEFADLL